MVGVPEAIKLEVREYYKMLNSAITQSRKLSRSNSGLTSLLGISPHKRNEKTAEFLLSKLSIALADYDSEKDPAVFLHLLDPLYTAIASEDIEEGSGVFPSHDEITAFASNYKKNCTEMISKMNETLRKAYAS